MAILAVRARSSSGAVLCSFWQREALPTMSGTATAWLRQLPDARLVEVFCDCPPEVAMRRFLGRVRHPGHCDGRFTPTSVLGQCEPLASQGPLGIRTFIRIDTCTPVFARDVMEMVARALGPHLSKPDGDR